jgi:hypothetical protein
MKLYSCKAIDELTSQYVNMGGEIFQINEGVLGYGDMILYDPSNRYKSYVVKEVPLNEWSSAHKVRAYNELPKKYADMLKEA